MEPDWENEPDWEAPAHRLSRIADAACDYVCGHPEWSEEIKGLFMLEDEERMSFTSSGYASPEDAFDALLHHLKVLAAQLGHGVVVVPRSDN